MAKKCKCPPAGAPEWVLTYGDMMSLLLVFFIMIVSLSEIKREDKFQAVVEEVQKAFGMKAGGGKIPVTDDPELSFLQIREASQLERDREQRRSNAIDPGIDGREPTVTRVREGLMHAVGGRITFEPGSADLTDSGKTQLRRIVEKEKIRGTNNIIELRGHAASMEDASGRTPDLWALSYARAQAVMQYLTSTEVGLRPDRFRLSANGDREPLTRRAYSAAEQEPNRRVEIFLSETLVRDMASPEPRAGQ